MSIPDTGPDRTLVDPHVLTDAESTISAAALLVHISQWQVVGLRNSRFLLFEVYPVCKTLGQSESERYENNAKLIM